MMPCGSALGEETVLRREHFSEFSILLPTTFDSLLSWAETKLLSRGAPLLPSSQRQLNSFQSAMANTGDLPEDLLLEILSLVPMKDLILNCRLVCTRWRDLVDLPVLWKSIYRRKSSDPEKQSSKSVFIFSHLEKNLIKNPCGEEGFVYWEVKTPPEGHWAIHEVSGKGKMKLKTKDFLQRNSDVEAKPHHLQVNKCFAPWNGFYSSLGCWYKLCVKLLSADSEVLKEYCSEDCYEHGWELGKWREVSYTFYYCPPGVRYILFEHQGNSHNAQKFKDRIRITKSTITIGPFCLEKEDLSSEYFYDTDDDIRGVWSYYGDSDDLGFEFFDCW
ncbi:F-box only protein 44-like isoform X2 [Rhineura floridana]|uniref:F-box only protein 44-like isoform X2 n=1 Tax=Rhineura floridana TaxID=261503 RepID=UPI002AC7EEAA|nr:F-box only protein 44-like isoform X2 [Rhineura floridana]